MTLGRQLHKCENNYSQDVDDFILNVDVGWVKAYITCSINLLVPQYNYFNVRSLPKNNAKSYLATRK